MTFGCLLLSKPCCSEQYHILLLQESCKPCQGCLYALQVQSNPSVLNTPALQTDSWRCCHQPKPGTRSNELSRLWVLVLQENAASRVVGFCTRSAKMWLSWRTFLPLKRYAGFAADFPLQSERESTRSNLISGWECRSSGPWVWPGHCWCLEPKGFAHAKAALLAPKQKGNPPENCHKGALGMITNHTGQH